MKKLKINFNLEFSNNREKDESKKSSQAIEFLKALFIGLLTSILASLILQFFFGL